VNKKSHAVYNRLAPCQCAPGADPRPDNASLADDNYAYGAIMLSDRSWINIEAAIAPAQRQSLQKNLHLQALNPYIRKDSFY
jgi:hypothetical protein